MARTLYKDINFFACTVLEYIHTCTYIHTGSQSSHGARRRSWFIRTQLATVLVRYKYVSQVVATISDATFRGVTDPLASSIGSFRGRSCGGRQTDKTGGGNGRLSQPCQQHDALVKDSLTHGPPTGIPISQRVEAPRRSRLGVQLLPMFPRA